MIGVLAVQGAFIEHIYKLRELGVTAKEVRKPSDLEDVDGLIIPGGESTAISLICENLGLMEPLRAFVRAKKPVYGTCAGMIMLSNSAQGQKEGGQALIGGLNVEVCRNYFGAQTMSFEAPLEIENQLINDIVIDESCRDKKFTGVFIRAPAILECGEGVEPIAWVTRARKDAQRPVLTKLENSEVPESRVIVAAKTDRLLVTAFHPEITESSGFHRLFCTMVEEVTSGTILPKNTFNLNTNKNSENDDSTLSTNSTFSMVSPTKSSQNKFSVPLPPPEGRDDNKVWLTGNDENYKIARRVVPGVDPMK